MSVSIDSIKSRLKNIAQTDGVTLQTMLDDYVREGVLRRLAQSPYSEKYALQGGMALRVHVPRRATRDMDMEALLDKEEDRNQKKIFSEICSIEIDDGITFNVDGITLKGASHGIKDKGVKLKIPANLGNIKSVVDIDVGFDTRTVPTPALMKFPLLLDGHIMIPCHHIESIVADKIIASLSRGAGNFRYRDYADLWMILSSPAKLNKAIVLEAMRQSRKRQIKGLNPQGLEEYLAERLEDYNQWAAKSDHPAREAKLEDIIEKIQSELGKQIQELFDEPDSTEENQQRPTGAKQVPEDMVKVKAHPKPSQGTSVRKHLRRKPRRK